MPFQAGQKNSLIFGSTKTQYYEADYFILVITFKEIGVRIFITHFKIYRLTHTQYKKGKFWGYALGLVKFLPHSQVHYEKTGLDFVN